MEMLARLELHKQLLRLDRQLIQLKAKEGREQHKHLRLNRQKLVDHSIPSSTGNNIDVTA